MASTNADGYSLSDLPLKDLGTTRFKAAVDIVKVPRGCVVTQESLLTGLNERNMDALPDIVKPQAECPVPFDFQIVMSNDVMLKHFIFTDKVDVRLFKSMCIGDPPPRHQLRHQVPKRNPSFPIPLAEHHGLGLLLLWDYSQRCQKEIQSKAKDSSWRRLCIHQRWRTSKQLPQ